jgi:DUF1680 family protein
MALLTGLILSAASSADAQGRRGRGRGQVRDPNDVGLNLAPVALASASRVSGDTSVEALNDNRYFGNSAVRPDQAYGNYNSRGTQWVQYEWAQPISTNKVGVYWWADGQGIALPVANRIKYWNGTAFVDVANASGLGVAGDALNITTFDEVMTSRLRLEMDADPTHSTGVVEWKVYDSGKSPKFPPRVNAGNERIVVLGGKTYLTATLRSLSDTGEGRGGRRGGRGEDAEAQAPATPSTTVLTWSKETGPGNVTFADASAAETTATFSALGDYVLKLTASEGALSSSATVKVKVDAPPPEKPLNVVYTKRYKIDNPLWNSRAKALIVNWIPHCIDQINTPDLRQGPGGIDNFIDAAARLRGEEGGRHRGYVFSNAWVHQTVESMCIGLMVDPQGDAEMIAAQDKFKKTLDEWIPIILAAQEPDGYLQTAFTLSPQRQRWTPRFRADHEGYVAGYFIESAINHYTLTEGTDLRLYNAAKKLADCWVANIGPEEGKREWFDGHQEMEQALVRFGRFVNDMEGGGRGDSYINLAKFLLDCRRNGSEYDQSHLPVQQQYEAAGHAVRAIYSYSGMADVATSTGDLDYRSAVMSLWDNITNKKYYVTGGVGSGETSEGFGPNYSLRHNAYCEACSSCGQIFFQYKMNLSYHDAKYADLYEETMYNALLGSIDLPGRNFYYQNPLNVGGARYPWHGCPCCVGNIPRTLLMIPTWTYVTDDDGIFVNLFIGGTINVERVAGTNVEMVQKTDYPWSGNVSITVNPAQAKAFAVRVRAPNRSVSEIYSNTPEADGITSLAVNGQAVPINVVNGYAVIERTWQPGDKIDVVLPMKVQRVKSIDDVAANRGRVALKYGPLVYNIETADGNNMNAILDPSAELTTEWRPDLLEGVVVIKGKFADGSDLLAIPNYARANRLAGGGRGRGNRGGGEGAAAAGGEGAAGGAAAGAGGQRRGRGGGGGGSQSVVWIRDQAE